MPELEVVGSTPLSSFVSIGEDAVYREASSSSIGNDVQGKSIRLYKGGLVSWRAAIAMVVFASLAAVAVLIVKCVAALRREGGESAIRRNLSEKGEATSDSEGGVECAVGEGLAGLSPPQQPASAEGQQEDGQPAAKRQRLDSSSADGAAGETSRTQSEAAAAAGLMLLSQQQADPSLPSETHVAPSQQSSEEQSLSHSHEAVSAAKLMSLNQQPSVPSSSSETHMPPSQQSAEGVALLLPVVILPLQPYFIVLGHGGDIGHPLPSTSAGVDGGSSDGAASAGSSLPQPHQQEGLESSAEERPGDSHRQPQESLFPRAVEAGETSAPSALPASPSSDEPSTSSGFLPQRHDWSAAVPLHAFARLPRLDNPEQREVFNPEQALMAPPSFTSVYQICKNMHRLFTEESLSPDELTQVVRMAELLAAHAIYNETGETSTVELRRAVVMLGRRFVFLDLLISTFELIGRKPEGEWWNRLTAAVPHALSPRTPYYLSFTRDQHDFRRDIAEQLSSAIQILKTGNRPSKKKLVELKRSIFCSPYTPKFFQQRLWDPWREDDEEAKKNGYTDA